MAGAICSLAFAGLSAQKAAPAKTDKALHHEHHAWMKKLHEDMKGKFEELGKTREAIDAAVQKNDDKEAATQIYNFLSEKHDIAKELHEKSKAHHEEMRKKHAGKGQDVNAKKHHEGMKKLHADLKAKLEALDAILEAAKAAIDKGDHKEAVTQISKYLDQKHELTKGLHDKMKKHHEEMRKKQAAGKGADVNLKKHHHEGMKKLHADMKTKFEALDATRDSIKEAVIKGDIHGAIEAISKFLADKHEITKDLHDQMKKHHEDMEKKFAQKGKAEKGKVAKKTAPAKFHRARRSKPVEPVEAK